MVSLLAFRDVSRRLADGAYGVAMLDRVSFDVDAGEAVGLWVPRLEKGGTVLLRIAAGLEVPDEGAVCWDGHVLSDMSADERARFRRQDGIALMKGSWQSLDSTSVIDHVAQPIYSDGMKTSEAEVSARRALEQVGATRLAHKDVTQLGLDDRLRVGLAHALAHRPRLLLVDEPAVLRGLGESDDIYLLLRELHTRFQFAMLVASEDVAALRGLGRVLSLANGTLVTDSDDNLFHFPNRRDHHKDTQADAS